MYLVFQKRIKMYAWRGGIWGMGKFVVYCSSVGFGSKWCAGVRC